MRRHVTVTVADSHAGDLAGVAGRLAQAGMQVEQVLAALGVITGSVEDTELASIEALPGVRGVEDQVSFQIPPPGADVQ